jgi:DNA-binding MarR family transcriptional regulator
MTAHDKAKNKQAFDLEAFVPYLLNRVGIRIAMEIAREFIPEQVSYSSWRVLFTLAHVGPRQMIELAVLANFEISTLSRVIAALERNGLVKRIEGEARNRGITLTARGSKLVERLGPIAFKYEAAALSDFTRAEREQLIALLCRLHRNLERHVNERDDALRPLLRARKVASAVAFRGAAWSTKLARPHRLPGRTAEKPHRRKGRVSSQRANRAVSGAP